MPVISRFYGMVVKMYFAAAEQHKAELRRIWDTQQFQSIPPLV